MSSNTIIRRGLTKYCFGVFLFALFSCRYAPKSETFSTVPSDDARPMETTNNYLLTGVWVVDSLYAPDCNICKQNNMKLNEMLHYKVHTKDTFMFTKDSMFYKSVSLQKLSEQFKFKDTLLELSGSDWTYTMTVRKYIPDTFSLAISQKYISDVNSQEGTKFMVLKLSRLE